MEGTDGTGFDLDRREITTEGGTGKATGDTGEAPGEGGGLGCGNDM